MGGCGGEGGEGADGDEGDCVRGFAVEDVEDFEVGGGGGGGEEGGGGGGGIGFGGGGGGEDCVGGRTVEEVLPCFGGAGMMGMLGVVVSCGMGVQIGRERLRWCERHRGHQLHL